MMRLSHNSSAFLLSCLDWMPLIYIDTFERWFGNICKPCYFHELLFSLVSLCINIYILEIILWIFKEITFFIFWEWIRGLILQSSKYSVNNMGKFCRAHKQRHFNDGVLSGRESMWVVYFNFGLVSKHSLQHFMVFLILPGCEQCKQCDQQVLTLERWRSSEGHLTDIRTTRHSLIHTLTEAHPHCTPYSKQTTCVCVCSRSHFQEVHEEANYCGFLL